MRFRTLPVSLVLLLTAGSPALAQPAVDDAPVPGAAVSTACVGQVQQRMAQQQRVYRSVLFGRRDAAAEGTGTVRYAEDGTAWLKTGSNRWRSDAKGYENTTWSDTLINERTEWEGMNEPEDSRSSRRPRGGIFTATGRLTSELVEPATQAFRALRCRAEMVCGALRTTLNKPGLALGTPIEVTSPGCMPLRTLPLHQCSFTNETAEGMEAERTAIDALSSAVVETVCDPLVREVVQREAEALKLAVSYDASYRTLLQFAGNFDPFLREFEGNLLSPIEDAMSLLGVLTRVPCFLSACNG